MQDNNDINPTYSHTRPNEASMYRLAVFLRILGQILGERYVREMNTRMPPWLVLS